jgi:hypothetical protein
MKYDGNTMKYYGNSLKCNVNTWNAICIPLVHHMYTLAVPYVHTCCTICTPPVHHMYTPAVTYAHTCAPYAHLRNHMYTTGAPYVHHRCAICTTCCTICTPLSSLISPPPSIRCASIPAQPKTIHSLLRATHAQPTRKPWHLTHGLKPQLPRRGLHRFTMETHGNDMEIQWKLIPWGTYSSLVWDLKIWKCFYLRRHGCMTGGMRGCVGNFNAFTWYCYSLVPKIHSCVRKMSEAGGRHIAGVWGSGAPPT